MGRTLMQTSKKYTQSADQVLVIPEETRKRVMEDIDWLAQVVESRRNELDQANFTSFYMDVIDNAKKRMGSSMVGPEEASELSAAMIEHAENILEFLS